MIKQKILLLFCIFFLQFSYSQIYVDANATGNTDGSSWTDAYTSLQDALDAATAGKEIWVAQGSYFPDIGTNVTLGDRNASFYMKNNVAIYGGFTGTETQRSQRDWETNTTTLSGNIGNKNHKIDNSKHIVRNNNTNSSAILDGFQITKGYAVYGGGGDTTGAGMYNTNASPTINNCVIINNWGSIGAAIYGEGGNPVFTNCTFRDNKRLDESPGDAIIYGTSNDTFINCSFINNISGSNGAVFHKFDSSVTTVINSYFARNTGASGVASFSRATGAFTNCTFTNNTGTNSFQNAGVLVTKNSASVSITNSILWNNSSPNGELLKSGGSITISNSILDDGTEDGTVTYSGGVTDGGNNLDSNPLFFNENYVTDSSPAINAGNNNATGLTGITTDIDGFTRIFDGTVDMGASEYENIAPTAICKNKTLQLDANGNASLNIADIDNGSTDNSGNFSLNISKTSFSCADLGNNTVTLTITDNHGSSTTCSATVTVENVTPPEVTVTNQFAYFDSATGYSIPDYTSAFPITDNCDNNPTVTQNPTAGTVINTDTDTTITLTASDASGNSQNYSFTLTTVSYNKTLSGPTSFSCPVDNTLLLNTSTINKDYYLVNETTNEIVGNTKQAGTGNALNFTTGILAATSTFSVYEADASYALTFNGTDENITTSSIPNLPNAAQDFSIELYVKTAQSNGTIASLNNLAVNVLNGNLSFNANGTAISSSTTINDNNWHHIVVTYNASDTRVRLYVDGTESINQSLANDSFTNSTLSMGSANNSTNYFNGEIAVARIWKKVLPVTEINRKKLNLVNPKEVGLVTYFPFFENTGTSLTDVVSMQSFTFNNMDAANWSTGTLGGVAVQATNLHTIDYKNSILYVDKTATGNATGCDWANAFTNIRDAVSNSTINGILYITGGTYQEGSQIFITKSLTIKGSYNTSGVQDIVNTPTIIDGNNAHRVLRSTHSSGILYLEGVTIQNGGGILYGAGIYSTGDLNIKNVKIINNNLSVATGFGTAITGGAGICTEKNITLNNSYVFNNKAISVTINTETDCTDRIVFCLASPIAEGGGIYAGGTATLINSVVANNRIESSASAAAGPFYATSRALGGGIFGKTRLYNCILYNNTKKRTENGTVIFDGQNEQEFGTLTANYSIVKDQNPSGTNNIDASVGGFNPLFVDAANGNFKLQNGSPLINAGLDSYNTTLADLDNNPRKVGTIDIGAYEFNNAANANTTWTGVVNTLWQEAGNWNNGLPTEISNVTIPTGLGNYPVITTSNNTTIFNLTNQANTTLQINADKSLQVNNTLINNGTITIHSNATHSGSLLVKGSSSGNINYNRFVTDDWHLVASPVIGQNINDFAVTNTATNQIIQNGDNTKYAIAPYNNDVATNNWEYLLVADVASAGDFTNGKGYSMKRATAGTYTFAGSLQTDDVTINLTDGSKNNWNLVGNPYPNFLNLNNLADGTNNLLAINAANLNPTNLALYLWDTQTDSYKPYNHSSTDIQYIAPGQGFFVDVKTGGGCFTMTKLMQTHQTAGIFSKNSNQIFEIKLSMSILAQSRNLTKSTEIKFIENTTKGLDIGYDAGVFSGVDNSFSIYTHLLENNHNKPFAIQCLPKSAIEELVIPIGVHAVANTSITFSIESVNLPEGIIVYLEDSVNNKFIDLSAKTYKTTLSNDSDGVGQFFVHTSSKALSIVDFNQNTTKISIYKSSERTLTIKGLQNKASVKVYSLLGKEIFTTQVLSSGKSTIDLPELSAGVYLCKVKSENGIVTKKIVLE